MSRTLSCLAYLFEKACQFEQLGYLAQACRTYQKLLDLHPDSAKLVQEARARLGRCQLNRGKFDEAQETLGLAVEENPDDADAQSLLAQAAGADENGDADRADEASAAAARLDPKNAEYIVAWAQRLLGRGDNYEALEAFRKALAAGKDDPEIVGRAAAGLRELGAVEESRKAILHALFGHRRDQRFQQLWNEHQYQVLWHKQQASARKYEPRAIIPFLGLLRAAT